MPKNKKVIDILDDGEVSVKAESLTATILCLACSCDESEQANITIQKSLTKALLNIAQQHITNLQEVITELMVNGYEHDEINVIDECLTDLHFALESIKCCMLSPRYMHPMIYGLRYISAKIEQRLLNLPDHLINDKKAQA